MTGPSHPTPPPPPPPSADVVTVDYEITRETYTWAFRELQRSVGAGKIVWGWFAAAVVLGLVAMTLVPGWPATALVVIGLLGLALVVMQHWLVPWVGYRWLPVERRRQRLELSPRGIVSTAPSFRQEHGWSSVRRVVHGPEVSLLETNAKGEGVVVARQVLTPAEVGRFERLVAEHAPHAEVTDRRRP